MATMVELPSDILNRDNGREPGRAYPGSPEVDMANKTIHEYNLYKQKTPTAGPVNQATQLPRVFEDLCSWSV
jgi:hypothetical protein